MAEKTLDAFKDTLGALIDANPHARNKGDKFKNWIKDIFGCDARISYIKEQRQITNRVSEQFRYFAPIVVFVCVPEVKRDTLIRYILERDYKQLESVAIIGATVADDEKSYKFERLITFKPSAFAEWIKPNFKMVEDAASLKDELGIPYDVAEGGEGLEITADENGQEITADESARSGNGENVLLYGVPGSGKSWTVEHEYCKPGTITERIVFHPDYTHADFIGQILPVVDPEDKQVTYEFTAGPFTNILKEAYQDPESSYALIIEEINRGNAPAIFGDVFQLLDRTPTDKTVDGITYPAGTSEYGVTNENIAKIVYNNAKRKVRIPSNLSIIGTMNTSDQNVFTLDTAFQRRWNMRLVENNFIQVRGTLASAEILDTKVSWRHFCETVNSIIAGNRAKMASAEDKRLGVYFVHERELKFDDRILPTGTFMTTYDEWNDLVRHEMLGTLDEEKEERLSVLRTAMRHNRMFPEKVIKYLWDDAFKFNPEALVDTKRFQSLEDVICAFVYTSSGKDRFNILNPAVRQLLYPDDQ